MSTNQSRLWSLVEPYNEAANIKKFAALYSPGGTHAEVLPPPGVRVPELLPGLASRRVLAGYRATGSDCSTLYKLMCIVRWYNTMRLCA